MDNDGFLYVSHSKKREVRRWKIGETNAKGNRLDQLNFMSTSLSMKIVQFMFRMRKIIV
jgi:hypothetical protein